MKKILLILLLFGATTYSQWNAVGLMGDTTFFSATITDSASGWSSYTVLYSAVYELLNFGADTVSYKIKDSAPAVTQVGIELPPLSSTGLIKLTVGAIVYFRERANPLYSKFTIKWQR